jgi:DNA processing protein
MSSLPPEAYAGALLGVPGATRARVELLLRRHDPVTAWSVLGEIGADPVVDQAFADRRRHAADAARPDLPARTWDRCQLAGVNVTHLGSPRYPAVFALDPQPPPVLFFRGALDALGARRAGIVGTRNATSVGRTVATRFGTGLAAAGVAVVSGLARGIDGCAHRGAIARPGGGPPVGVVACGLDVPYPAEHRRLWDEVAHRGLLLSEHPPGTSPRAHQFPNRNRLIAALSEVLVVVESRARGGSLITARFALGRGGTVMAVPGALTSAAAAGTNELLRDGALVALDCDDILVALGLEPPSTGGRAVVDRRPVPAGDAATVLGVFGGEALTLDHLALRSGLALPAAARALGVLEATGWVRSTGGWFEPVLAGAVEP